MEDSGTMGASAQWVASFGHYLFVGGVEWLDRGGGWEIVVARLARGGFLLVGVVLWFFVGGGWVGLFLFFVGFVSFFFVFFSKPVINYGIAEAIRDIVPAAIRTA